MWGLQMTLGRDLSGEWLKEWAILLLTTHQPRWGGAGGEHRAHGEFSILQVKSLFFVQEFFTTKSTKCHEGFSK